ncbi:MAG: helix-turn-helix transcriptional regulator [Devosia nanyangense]|uniref:Helix-turn-helix transcriptional regulator n=1 Tax=Devosia nanyangense TaxID=1228055 RepID=A0A933L5I4_9HYPH|nr:helix-turn-helix transcriptional regulator [Devosia nanyangense]
MDMFAKRLKERAAQLGISDREAARQCGLEERRYAHYAGNRREPDLDTLVRIANGLGTTPNWLLGLDGEGKRPTKRTALLERLATAAREFSDEELRISVIQAEALVRAR